MGIFKRSKQGTGKASVAGSSDNEMLACIKEFHLMCELQSGMEPGVSSDEEQAVIGAAIGDLGDHILTKELDCSHCSKKITFGETIRQVGTTFEFVCPKCGVKEEMEIRNI